MRATQTMRTTVQGRGWRGLLALAAAVALGAGCDVFGGDDDPQPEWPRQFDAFAFTTDVVVVFPGTCRGVRFEYATSPPTRLDELELTIVEGSLRVHTDHELDGPTGPGQRGGSGTWRVCAGVEEPVEGVIRVAFKDHPDYFAETRLVQRRYLERITGARPVLSLPVVSTYPSDVRWSDDGARLEVARTTGEILHIDPATGIIEEVEYTVEGGVSLVRDDLLLNVPTHPEVARLVHRGRGEILSTVSLWDFGDGTGHGGQIRYAHGRGDTLALVGSTRPGPNFTSPVFVSHFDLAAKRTEVVTYGIPQEDLGHFPHVTVASDGRRLAWAGIGFAHRSEPGSNPFDPLVGTDASALYEIGPRRECAYPGSRPARGQQPARAASRPAFSPDGQWLAIWATDVNPNQFASEPVLVYHVPACVRRAQALTLPTGGHRAGVALSPGADRLAVVVLSDLRLYAVPSGVGQDAQLEESLTGIHVLPLNHDGVGAGSSDRTLLARDHFRYPGLLFSDDGRYLVSASTRGARIIDLEDGYRAVETPHIDAEGAELHGGYLRVPTFDGGDLLYHVGALARGFVHRLGEDEVFLGVDPFGWLYLRSGDEHLRRSLEDGAEEALGPDAPEWTEASPAGRIELTDDGLEVWR